jgi:hypothetical protein
MNKMPGSLGVLMEPVQGNKTKACPGCPGNIILCTVRTIAREFLADGNASVVVVSELPRQAQNVSQVFHPSHAPWLSGASQSRMKENCQQLHQLAGAAPGGAHMRLQGPRAEDEQQKARGVRCGQLYLAELLLLGAAKGLIHTAPGTAASSFIRARLPIAPGAALDNAGLGASQEQPGFWNTTMSAAASPATQTSALQGWWANSTAGEAHLVKPVSCVCTSPVVRPLELYLKPDHFTIDSELKIVYCNEEKVASTTILMLIRGMKGIFTGPIHGKNNLTTLEPGQKKSKQDPAVELRNIRDMSRTDYLKFVFVRNPFTRILSTYRDKILQGGKVPIWYTKTSSIPRRNQEFWFRTLFRKQHPGGNLTFGQFIEYTVASSKEAHRMNDHVATQTDNCNLKDIKFDFVGHFESLGDDLERLWGLMSKRLGRNLTINQDLVEKGHSFHLTKSDNKLLEFYNAELVKQVAELYAVDMDNRLNGVHYEVPPPLQAMVQQIGMDAVSHRGENASRA